jgi:uncharacterized sporulation protein YeaH/YhbH (DUF444 family)
MLENRYPVDKWNVYVFYFTDGENWDNDNERLISVIKKNFTPQAVNMIGITQVLSYTYENSVKHYIDQQLDELGDHIRTTSIEAPENEPQPMRLFYPAPSINEEERDVQIKKAIHELLGKGRVKEKKKVIS